MPLVVDSICFDELTADPASPVDGQKWFNTTEGKLKIKRGGQIVEVATDPDLDTVTTVAPTVNDDSSAGHSICSMWCDTTNDKAYICLDASVGAAVWLETTVQGGAASHALGDTTHTVDTLANLNAKISDATLIDTADARLSDARVPTSHGLGGAEHAADTLANLNAKISDATLIDTGDARLSDARDADAIITTTGPTTMAVGAVADGEFLKRSGSTIIGAAAGGGSPVSVEDEGTPLTTGVTKLNFAGAGVTVTEPVADEVLVTIPGPSVSCSETVATDNTLTTSATYVLIANMTITPASGTYLVMFSSSGEGTDKDQICNYAIYSDGTIVAHTERDFHNVSGHIHVMDASLHTQACVTVNGSQAIAVYYKTSSPGTFTVRERSLILLKLA